MTIYDSKLWLADLDTVLAGLPELKELTGKAVLVTGCTGLICSAVMDLLIRWNEFHADKITIMAAGRRFKNIVERFNPFVTADWFKFVSYDASDANNYFNDRCDYIIHGASNASPAKYIKEPVETLLSNVLGIKCLLDYAKGCNAKRVLFISSSEVYGKKEGAEPYRLGDYGYIDLLNVRNSYSIGKRAAETLCVSYAVEYGVETVIVRPGHIYGPTAKRGDNRVSSAWAYDVAEGKNIVMKSDGAQIRSYCYCLDCASAILKVLLKGKSCQAYNISNPDSVISIRQMAELLIKSASVQLFMEQPTVEEMKGFNPMSNSSMDSTELLSLGWQGLFDAEKGFRHTVEIIKEKQE